MVQLQIFVSHAGQDREFCRQLVTALRQASADVWYDEHNLHAGKLTETIQEEIRKRNVFIVILSPAALQSEWVKSECKWACILQRNIVGRVILPVLAERINELYLWMFLQDFKRIEASGGRPFPAPEAIKRTLSVLTSQSHDYYNSENQDGAGESAPYDSGFDFGWLHDDDPATSPEALTKQGKAFLSQGNVQDAFFAFHFALRQDPTSFDAWIGMSIAQQVRGQLQGALDACEKALAINNESSEAWRYKGQLLAWMNKETDALPCIERAVQLDPFCAPAWVLQGVIFGHAGKFREATAALDRAIEIKPDDDLAWGVRSATLLSLGRTSESLASANRALELKPTNIDAWINKANALAVLQRYDQALNASEHALRIDPNQATSWCTKGTMLNYLLKHDEALAAFDRAIALDPGLLNAWINKGVGLMSLGRYGEAVSVYDHALKIDPNSALARQHKQSAQDLESFGASSFLSLTRPSEGEARCAEPGCMNTSVYRCDSCNTALCSDHSWKVVVRTSTSTHGSQWICCRRDTDEHLSSIHAESDEPGDPEYITITHCSSNVVVVENVLLFQGDYYKEDL